MTSTSKTHDNKTQEYQTHGNQKKLRMLISSDCFLPRWDGVSRFLVETLPSLAEEFEVTVICPNFGQLAIQSPKLPAKIVRFPVHAWRVGDINLARIDSSHLKKLIANADIVFNQTLGPIGMTTLQQSHRMGKPVISFIHSIDWELFSRSVRWGRNAVWYFTRWYEQFLYNRCKMLLVPSGEVKEIFDRSGIHIPKRVVPLGVNIDKFKPAKSKEKAKCAIRCNPQEFIIGFSGRIAREKDLPTLKKGFDEVKSQPRFKNKIRSNQLKLLIVGEGVASEQRRIAGDGVIIAGAVNNVVPYLQAMDVFVLSSLTETSSLATMEAMACGLPVISTPVGKIKEYIVDGVNGLLFPKGNAEMLAQRISFLINNQETRKDLGKAARQTAVREFRWIKTTNEIKKAVTTVLKK